MSGWRKGYNKVSIKRRLIIRLKLSGWRQKLYRILRGFPNKIKLKAVQTVCLDGFLRSATLKIALPKV
jgi:hypothetical protein